jgi:hypothetical protein
MKTYNEIESEKRAWSALQTIANHSVFYSYTIEQLRTEIGNTLFEMWVSMAKNMVRYAIAELNNKGVTDTQDLEDTWHALGQIKPNRSEEEIKAEEYRKWLADYEANRPDTCVYSDVAQEGGE